MKLNRPSSSNPFKYRKITKKMRLINALNKSNNFRKLSSFNSNRNSFTHIMNSKASLQLLSKTNIKSNNSTNNLDVLNLIIKSNPSQYNYQKISKKSLAINPLFMRGTDENLKRPNFNKNTEEVFYKYNLLYGSDTTNIIRTYSPKMRPMSSSINGFNKKMAKDLNESISVFSKDEIIELTKARCKDIGIDLRENMVYKFIDYCNAKCQNRIVDLSEFYLGLNSIKLISKIIYNSDRISRLNLMKNNLGDNGIEILINSIKNNMSLISLNITSNSITCKGGKIIFTQLKEQQSIIELNVSSIEGTNRNRMTAAGIKDIESFLKINLFLESINLSGNSIKDEGFIIICKGLDDNNSLLYLNISNNDIHSKGLNQGLNLIKTCNLYSLNISNNPILDEGVKKLTNSLKYLENLHKLNISFCNLSFSGFEYLIKALQFIKRIEYLNVSGNNLKSPYYERIKLCFPNLGIRNLNMSKCELGNESAYTLGECLMGNETIRNINISENKISDSGFQSFVDLFSNNNSIEVFDCSINYISDVTAKEFIQNMKYNRTLKKINFYDNQLKNDIGNVFIELLEVNKTLTNINLMYNRVQIKIIDEINRILKLNSEKQKSKFIPNIQKDIKSLQFNPELFKFYTQSIKNKKIQQEILYKKVKQDDKHYSKLLNKNNKKIDIKVQENEIIKNEIMETQEKIKEIKDNIDILQSEIYKYEEKINDKIDIQRKQIKIIKDQNDMLKVEYNATKKDLESVKKETEEKLKQSVEKLNIANISVDSMTRELIKKNKLLEDLNNPDMIGPIKDNTLQKKTNKIIKKVYSNNIIYSNNISSDQNNTGITTTPNDNNNTNNSGYNEYKTKDTLRNTTKKSILYKQK